MSKTGDIPTDEIEKDETQHTKSESEEIEDKIDEEMEPEKDKYIIAKPKRIIIKARIKK